MTEDIFVVGMGIVTSLGVGKEATLRALRREVPCIDAPRFLQTSHTDIPVGEVPYNDSQLAGMLGSDVPKTITRTTLLGRVALKEALEEARLDCIKPRRVAFISGTTVGGMEKSEQYYTDFISNMDHSEYIALHDCGACTDMIAGEFSGKFDIMTTISTACSSAANAVILGANLIRMGMVDAAVVGGSECLSRFHLNGFNSLMILDKEHCRPFDKNRAGLNLGEGAGYLVLESSQSAMQRGGNTLCRLAGYGNACDAYHQTATSPNGEGPYLAMIKALESAGLTPQDIDYVNAHGTGTPNNDLSEGIAMSRVFGDHIPPVSSTKSFTGHTTSASGGIESVISILALLNNYVPASLGCNTRIEGLGFLPSNRGISSVELKNVLTNSFGFGGNDSSIIFSKY
ncbi:MAG: beta-ketoacyl-[acyl-carrier-protein] synthase family protein [Bacteroidales bacterium]|nr:beta-ketoacyl-[acyl-carrier-protein] synthase family protein [Bacteroidales bacterium]